MRPHMTQSVADMIVAVSRRRQQGEDVPRACIVYGINLITLFIHGHLLHVESGCAIDVVLCCHFPVLSLFHFLCQPVCAEAQPIYS
jgi:hypothetical protein